MEDWLDFHHMNEFRVLHLPLKDEEFQQMLLNQTITPKSERKILISNRCRTNAAYSRFVCLLLSLLEYILITLIIIIIIAVYEWKYASKAMTFTHPHKYEILSHKISVNVS